MNKILLLVFCMTTFLGFSQNSSSSSSQPNIVFIFSDDHSTNAISAYGGLFKELAPTPNIDQIAKEGALEHFHVNAYFNPLNNEIVFPAAE